MNVFEIPKVSLETFEGPLDLLLHLVQKAEVDIFDIVLTNVTEQFRSILEEASSDDVNLGCEFLSLTSSLILLKSKRLLPEDPSEIEEQELASVRYDILEHLIEYSHFKKLAKNLTEREQSQNKHFPRGITLPPPMAHIPKKVGLEQLTLFDLADYLKESLSKAHAHHGSITDEEWKVSDKILEINELIKLDTPIPLEQIFKPTQSKTELITSFLAILELIKQGRCKIFIQTHTLYISGTQHDE